MSTPEMVSALNPAMPCPQPPEWDSAIWVGSIDLPAELASRIELEGAGGYRRARLLVRSEARPVALVTVGIDDGGLDGAELEAAVHEWNVGHREAPWGPVATPFITVVICTRNRVELLRSAVQSVLACEYPYFDLVVVDNASDDDATEQYVSTVLDPRVSYIREPVPGLAVARNAGVKAAAGEIVAFTDDDVVVDRLWLQWIGRAFESGENVGCVTGIVPSGELRTPTQSYFEKRVSWSKNLTRTVFDVSDPPSGSPLFPFQVGLYGTGANFALRRAAVVAVGGFDEGLGVGSPTGGGEDIDMFVRVLVSSWKLVYEPAAIVWHRHRHDVPALQTQARDYGLGLGAWLTKVALDRTLGPMAVRRMGRAVRHLRVISESPDVDNFEPPESLRKTQLIGIVRGPIALAAARRQGRRPRPLRS
jgi:GT2 family glycosyltransferase